MIDEEELYQLTEGLEYTNLVALTLIRGVIVKDEGGLRISQTNR